MAGTAMMAVFIGPVAAQGESVVVPLACSVESGRLAVSPAPERTHPILGSRSSHAFTTCAGGNAQRCRTWMVHKFDLSCDGHRVSWLGLVGAASEKDDPRVRVIANRFTLRMPPGWSAARPGTTAGDNDVVAFPVGFAPAMRLPVRFTGTAERPPTVVAWDKPRAEDKLVRIAAASPLAVTGQVTEVTHVAPASEVSSWLVTVEPVVTAIGASRERLGAVAVAVVLAWSLLFFVRRRIPVFQHASALWTARALPAPDAADPSTSHTQPRPETQQTTAAEQAGEADSYAAHCARMISQAVSLHKAARDELQEIAHASLRGVLQEDLEKAQAILLAPNLAADIAAGSWSAVELAVARVLADLDRIGRIIDGVTGTRSPAAHDASALPETANDAFQLLGVTPDASPLAVKKIVDGLRLSWHPDHARDEIDRSIREARLKQINVAWDLIQDRQKAA